MQKIGTPLQRSGDGAERASVLTLATRSQQAVSIDPGGASHFGQQGRVISIAWFIATQR